MMMPPMPAVPAPPVPAGPMTDEAWAAAHAGPASVTVRETSSGRMKAVTLAGGVSSTIAALKQAISESFGLAPNKQKLQIEGQKTFLKDGQTLTSYRLDAQSVVELITKERGGRKAK